MREALLEIIKDETRVVTENIEQKYLSDTLGRRRGTAAALVFPTSAAEVSGILKYAYENGVTVTPRGAGTNLVGSTIPSGGIVMDFSEMNHILEIDEETFTATVEPGVILEDFQKTVEEMGLFYPPDPGEKRASIGGNISTNAGGMRAVKYGVTRDYVMGLEIVLADGTIVWAGSKNRKDTSGLSIKDIVIGSEGTLAVITKCILKLIPKPEENLSVLVAYDGLKWAVESVQKIIKANITPTAIEFLERKVVKLGEDFLGLSFPESEAAAYILLTFDGKKEQIAGNLETLAKIAAGSGARNVIPLKDKQLAADVWKIRGILVKAVEAVSEQEPLDIVVPINRIADFVRFVNELEKESKMTLISFGHAGDGNVHLCVVRGGRSEERWNAELDQNLSLLYGKAHELGGLVSGEHGVGLSKQKYLAATTETEKLALMRSIKRAFDGKRILNPGISYDMAEV